MNFEGCIKKREELTDDRVLTIVPFDSQRKRGSIVVKYNDKVRVYCKGAPDVLFPMVTKVLIDGGE